MRHLLILLALIAAISGSVGATADTTTLATPFLGLAVPYPDSIPSWVVKPKAGLSLKNPVIPAALLVGEDGRVTDVRHSLDRSDYIDAVRNQLAALRFRYSPGRTLIFPMTLPIEVRFSVLAQGEWRADPRFPVGPGFTCDSMLLRLMFEENGIRPPALSAIPPLFYRPDASSKDPDYLIITARVSIDEAGNLTDVAFPILGQDRMTHQVLVALMNAKFLPLLVNEVPSAAEFLLTFRIFDNLRYPYSPLAPPDTTDTLPVTAGHFLSQHYSAGNLAMPPLPRNHSKGYIHTAAFGKKRFGVAQVKVMIDETGAITGVLPLTASPALSDIVRDVIRLTTWYPAITAAGERTRFTGTVRMRFDGTPRIVYNPEWLSR